MHKHSNLLSHVINLVMWSGGHWGEIHIVLRVVLGLRYGTDIEYDTSTQYDKKLQRCEAQKENT